MASRHPSEKLLGEAPSSSDDSLALSHVAPADDAHSHNAQQVSVSVSAPPNRCHEDRRSSASSSSDPSSHNLKEYAVQDDIGSSTPEQWTVYRMRWLQLPTFALCMFANQMLWVTFAPISSISEEYFGVSTSQINVFSLLFMILFLPGTLLGSYVTDRYGMRACLLTGAVLQGVGGCLRYLAVFSGSGAYAVAIAGQVLAGIAQPPLANAAVALADTWFPVSERDLCTVVASMSGPIGIALGQLVPTFLVPADGDPSDIDLLLLVEGAITLFAMIVAIAVLREHPPTPPSRSAHERMFHVGKGTSTKESILVFWRDAFTMLFRNFEFLKLWLGFGMGVGVFNAVTTLVEQLVRGARYDSDDAGLFGGALVIAGIVSAGVAGVVMDKTHAYKACLRTGVVGAVVFTFFWLAMIKPDNFDALLASFAVLGVFLLPLLPISLENAVEVTYPIPHEGPTALMALGGQIWGIVFILVLEQLLDKERTFDGVFPSSSILTATVMSVAALLLFWFNGETKRSNADLVKHVDVTKAVAASDSNDGQEKHERLLSVQTS